MHVTQVFHLHVVLNWMMNGEVDPGGHDERFIVFFCDDRDGCLSERRFTLYKLWLVSQRIGNGMLVSNNSVLCGGLAVIGEYRTTEC